MAYFVILGVFVLAAIGLYSIIKWIIDKFKDWRNARNYHYAPRLVTGDALLDIQYEEWQERYDADENGFSIAGANFRNLDETHLGEFIGKLKLEPDNPYDKNAIAIYRGRKKVGYIPRGMTILLKEQFKINGGSMECFGFIHTFINEDGLERFAGTVIPGIKPGDEETT